MIAISGDNGTVQNYIFANGRLTLQGSAFTPFVGFSGPIRAAIGDFNGDGVFDTAYGVGPTGGSLLRVIDGATGKDLIAAGSVATLEGGYAGGLFVETGDIDGDGSDEFVVTPDVGGGGRVQIFRIQGGQLNRTDNFFGIDDDNFRGGARASFGDIDGDGLDDLIVAAGFGGGPRIAIFDGRTLGSAAIQPVKLVNDFFAFPGIDAERLRNGAYVTAGDFDGDGKADLAFGGGPGGGPRVYVLRGPGVLTNVALEQANPLANFFVAGDSESRGGVRLTVKDIDNDHRADLVTASGDGMRGMVRTYMGSSLGQAAGESAVQESFAPFGNDAQTNGVFVG